MNILASIVAICWSIDQILKVVAGMTGNKSIDNIADGLAKILTLFFQSSQPKGN